MNNRKQWHLETYCIVFPAKAGNSEIRKANGPEIWNLPGKQPKLVLRSRQCKKLWFLFLHPHFCYLKIICCLSCREHSNKERVGLSKENVLLRGCTVRNTEAVVGIVVYAGLVTLLAFYHCLLSAFLPINIFYLLKMQSTKAERKLCLDKLHHWSVVFFSNGSQKQIKFTRHIM